MPGTYTLTLTTTNAQGTDSASRPIRVDPLPPPVAAFDATPTSGTVPLEVTVADRSTGAPANWSWRTRDGSLVVEGRSPGAHTYGEVGPYTITLSVSNAQARH